MTAHNATAVNLAAKLSDEAFEGHMLEAINSKEVDRRNPIVIMSDLNRIFADVIGDWPQPDTDKDSGTNNPAIVQVQDGTRKVNVNFYWELYDNSEIGKAQIAYIDNLKKGRDKDASAPADLQGKDKDWYASEIALATQRRNYGRAAIVRAMKLQWQCWEIGDKMKDTVGFAFLTSDNDGVEEFSRSTKPVKVFENIIGGSSDVISIGTFLNLDVDTAVANGGTFAELMKTANRERKKPEVTGIKIETFAEYDDGVATMATFMRKISTDKKAQTRFIAELAKKDSDDLLISMYWLNAELDKYLTSGNMETRIQDLLSNPVNQ